MNPIFSRRQLIGTGAFGLGGALLPQFIANAQTGQNKNRARGAQQPKNIIFLVADGMSMGVPSMLDHYLQLTSGKSSFWRTLMQDPDVVQGLQDTRSLSSIVTDSAAAASSWGSGIHVWNGMINTLPDGTKLRTLYDILGEQKMRRGLVSTATITHATPAGFSINVHKRDDEEGIALSYLNSGIDVIMGGGDKFFAGKHRKDKRDLYTEFAKKNYAIARNKASLKAAQNKKGKVLGIFSSSHVPYYVDRLNDASLKDVPSLEEMTRAAISHLDGSSQGFILQVEAGRVDHAAHANDFAGLVYDLLEFEKALKVAVDFARKDGNTLVIATSDHSNSNPGLNGSGREYFNSTAGLKRLTTMQRSYESILSDFASGMEGYDAHENHNKLVPTIGNVQGLIEKDLAVKLSREESQLVVDALTGKSTLKSIEQYQLISSSLAIALGNHTHIGWTGRQHTNDFTIVTALGPGASAFGGLNQNISFFNKLLDARGLKWNNPTMSFEKAQQTLGKEKLALQDAIGGHWV